jgi:hypothetical protein
MGKTGTSAALPISIMATQRNKASISYQFNSYLCAWQFMRALQAIGIISGYPDLRSNSVAVAVDDSEQADSVYATSEDR